MTVNIYRITNKKNGWVYIGSTKGTIEERFAGHGRSRHRVDKLLYQAMRESEESDWKIETLIKVAPEHRWAVEAEMTIQHRVTAPGVYNIADGAYYTHTEETKARMSATQKGRKHSDETKEKISATHTGNKNPMYGRTGDKHPRWGKSPSAETRAQMSAALTDDKHPMAQSVLDTQTGITYTTRKAAAKAIGKSTTYISTHPERFKYERRTYNKKEL